MPLRIDTGRLSDLARQRGQFRADASAREWQTLGALGEGTMGAYQGEIDRQADEARAKSQDEYYDVMRRQNEAQLKSDERERADEVEARNVMRRFVNKQGDVDFVALSQDVTSGDYSPGVASHVQSLVEAGLARGDQAAERSLKSAEKYRTELMKVAGDLDTVAQGSGRAEMYLLKQPGWFARAVELGMPEARASELFLADFNLRTVVSTADILRGQAEMAAKQEIAIGAGASYFKGDLESIEDQQKLVMRSLAVDPDMTQEKLDAYWSDAAGDDRLSLDDRMWDLSTMGALGAAEKWEGFNKRTISPEVLASFDDLRTFDEGWRERFEAHGDRIFTEEDKTLDQEIMTAFNNQNYARLEELFALQEKIALSKSNKGPDEPKRGPAQIPSVSLTGLNEELAIIAGRVNAGEGGTYEVIDPATGDPTYYEGMSVDAGAAASKKAENIIRQEHNLMPVDTEKGFIAAVRKKITDEADGGLEEMEVMPGLDNWRRQQTWDAGNDGKNGKARRANTGRMQAVGLGQSEQNIQEGPTIEIPDDVIREWALELFETEDQARDMFRGYSQYDVRGTLHTFGKNWKTTPEADPTTQN